MNAFSIIQMTHRKLWKNALCQMAHIILLDQISWQTCPLEACHFLLSLISCNCYNKQKRNRVILMSQTIKLWLIYQKKSLQYEHCPICQTKYQLAHSKLLQNSFDHHVGRDQRTS